MLVIYEFKKNQTLLPSILFYLKIILFFFWMVLIFPLPVLGVETKALLPHPEFIDQTTKGAAIPILCNPDLQDCKENVQLLGTINNNRGRWNPFLPENNMVKDGKTYYKEVELKANGGRHHDGVYAFRFVVNHDLYETVKANHNQVDSMGKPQLVDGEKANQAQNIIIKADHDGLYNISFNPQNNHYDITPQVTYLTKIRSLQINGFVWDDEDMFQKFDETRSNHEMIKNGDWWEKTIPLKTIGGIDFRADGVYQFLFSVNHNEDWGFGAYNDGQKNLTGGTGFGSSGGQSKHSAITIQVLADGDYTFRINPINYQFEVIPPEGIEAPQFLNDITSFQLLGTFYPDHQFDPTVSEHNLQPTSDNIWSKIIELEPGIYTANIGISQELFLDTMALGAWLVSDQPNQIIGKNWHGKPNEPNIFFAIQEAGQYQFNYDADRDQFSLASLNENPVQPLAEIETLQLVGDFDDPLVPWEPTNIANNMEQQDNHIFIKEVKLEENQTYNYKYTANNWDWLWVFADYELDGYGDNFSSLNPDPLHSELEDLKTYGQLTTHGDPPTLKFTPANRGCYRFIANLETGAYAVEPSNNNDCEKL
jgi:hypothetical protein